MKPPQERRGTSTNRQIHLISRISTNKNTSHQPHIIHYIEGFQFVWRKKQQGKIHFQLEPISRDLKEAQKRGHQTTALSKEFLWSVLFIPHSNTQITWYGIFSILFPIVGEVSTRSSLTSTPQGPNILGMDWREQATWISSTIHLDILDTFHMDTYCQIETKGFI